MTTLRHDRTLQKIKMQGWLLQEELYQKQLRTRPKTYASVLVRFARWRISKTLFDIWAICPDRVFVLFKNTHRSWQGQVFIEQIVFCFLGVWHHYIITLWLPKNVIWLWINYFTGTSLNQIKKFSKIKLVLIPVDLAIVYLKNR